MIAGPKLTLGDREFTIAPANLGSVKRQMKGYEEHAPGTVARMDVSMQFVLDVLQRNHPDVDMAFLETWLDTRNMPAVMAVISTAAGYEEKQEGEQAS